MSIKLPEPLIKLNAIRKLQSAYRAKKARATFRAMKAEKSSKETHSTAKWTENYDAGSGYNYYFNNETHETVWEKPDDFVSPA